MSLENVILTVENCRYCLMCRHVAPVELVTHKESYSPHGWGLLIASVRRGLLDWNADTVEAIYSAPDGGNSRAHCVTDQPLPEAIAAVRAEIVDQKLAPSIVYQLDESFGKWGTPFAEQAPEPRSGTGEDALFVGDEALYLWPQALKAALKLLKSVGVEPALIGRGRNNGFLASSLGLKERAVELAKANLAELEASKARRMFVLSPGDYFTFCQLYDERLGIHPPVEVEILELVPYLAEKLAAGELNLFQGQDRGSYAYLDPTHAVRVPDRHEAPRALVEAVRPNGRRELFWRKERAHPVGSTALQFTRPVIAEKLTQARLEDARQQGATVLVTEDPGTLYQLNKGSDEGGVKVQGLYELLAGHLV